VYLRFPTGSCGLTAALLCVKLFDPTHTRFLSARDSTNAVHMSLLRLHRLSVVWKNWMFNQDPEASDAGSSSQVENASESDDDALQRHGPQRHSRRRFHKVNAGGERQLIVDAQDASDAVRAPI